MASSRDELARVLDDAQRAFRRAALRMDPERVRWWHGAISPANAGGSLDRGGDRRCRAHDARSSRLRLAV